MDLLERDPALLDKSLALGDRGCDALRAGPQALELFAERVDGVLGPLLGVLGLPEPAGNYTARKLCDVGKLPADLDSKRVAQLRRVRVVRLERGARLPLLCDRLLQLLLELGGLVGVRESCGGR